MSSDPKNTKRVYIAGPLTSGDVFRNISNALREASIVRDLGYCPFIPHLSFIWEIKDPQNYEKWMEWCLCWVGVCDAVYRIPGESHGADREVTFAKENGIKVAYNIGDLVHVLEEEK